MKQPWEMMSLPLGSNPADDDMAGSNSPMFGIGHWLVQMDGMNIDCCSPVDSYYTLGDGSLGNLNSIDHPYQMYYHLDWEEDNTLNNHMGSADPDRMDSLDIGTDREPPLPWLHLLLAAAAAAAADGNTVMDFEMG